MQLLFSVIIPVYNTKTYLSECVDSVLAQNRADYEIILVDDGSSDGSELICDEYAKANEKIRVIHQSNMGLSAARNAGIEGARGEYILFLDSDDVLLGGDALSELAEPLLAHAPSVLMCLPREYNEDFTSIVAEHEPLDINKDGCIYAKEAINRLYKDAAVYVTLAQTKIARADFLLKNNLFFTLGTFHEDDEWIARLLLANPTLFFCGKAFYGYRHRTNSIVSTTDSQKMQKKANDRINIALKLLADERICAFQNMHDYFLSYFIGAYSQMLSLDCEIDKEIPFDALCSSSRCKMRALGKIKKIFGYRFAKRLFERYLEK